MHATTLARDQIWTKGQLNSYRILGHSKLLSAEEEKSWYGAEGVYKDRGGRSLSPQHQLEQAANKVPSVTA